VRNYSVRKPPFAAPLNIYNGRGAFEERMEGQS